MDDDSQHAAEFKTWLIATFKHHWENGGVVIGLRPQCPGTRLPKHLMENELVVLDYNPCAVVPITDLQTNDLGILATLSFGRTAHKTFVPWEAIVGMKTREEAETEEAAPSPKPKRHLSLV